ncbi:DUF397 domain-containing protein [Nocardiopsis tropica]|uniref:DUF397 domain-containing protein n=1 Tax=Nocardiopsis tropica TaxID=109330 RepID=A0ABU7KTJ8_9ACTN|nr:DUF397 domain-containing protein [Nocardiopsis umidischolae]MEE2052402.1 DUF397 domain-containing protein [Nocardiopsis umidischolae]
MSTVDKRSWHKSSYSGNQGACVEIAEGPVTGIRDTQNRTQGQIDVPAPEWTALVNAVRCR